MPDVRVVLLASSAVLFCGGLFNVAELPFATGELELGDAGFAMLVALFGLGFVAGSLIGASGGDLAHLKRRYLIGLLLMALSLVGLGLAEVVGVAAAAFAAAGVANGMVLVYERLIIQAATPKALLGRVFGIKDSLTAWAFAAAFLSAGGLMDLAGIRSMLFLAGWPRCGRVARGGGGAKAGGAAAGQRATAPAGAGTGALARTARTSSAGVMPPWRSWTTQISVSTTPGSNCVPAPASSSTIASSRLRAVAVDPVGGHGVVGVAGEDQARLERDLLAAQSIRIAGPVPALVARADHLADPTQEASNPIEHELPLDRVRLHDLELRVGEGRRLVQDLLGNGDLADVVEQRGELDLLAVLLPDPELVGHRVHQVDDRAAVRRRVGIVELDHVREQHDRAPVGAVELERRRVALLALAGEDGEQPDERSQGEQSRRLVEGHERGEKGDRREHRVDSHHAEPAGRGVPQGQAVHQLVSKQRPQQIASDLAREREHVDGREVDRGLTGCECGEDQDGPDRQTRSPPGC